MRSRRPVRLNRRYCFVSCKNVRRTPWTASRCRLSRATIESTVAAIAPGNSASTRANRSKGISLCRTNSRSDGSARITIADTRRARSRSSTRVTPQPPRHPINGMLRRRRLHQTLHEHDQQADDHNRHRNRADPTNDFPRVHNSSLSSRSLMGRRARPEPGAWPLLRSTWLRTRRASRRCSDGLPSCWTSPRALRSRPRGSSPAQSQEQQGRGSGTVAVSSARSRVRRAQRVRVACVARMNAAASGRPERSHTCRRRQVVIFWRGDLQGRQEAREYETLLPDLGDCGMYADPLRGLCHHPVSLDLLRECDDEISHSAGLFEENEVCIVHLKLVSDGIP